MLAFLPPARLCRLPCERGDVVRIIGGTARGTKLAPFDGLATRPTPDRVREAIFSIIFSRIGPLPGKRVADLFAGTGAMGIEALSRGADSACLVETNPLALRLIEANLNQCRVATRAQLVRGKLPEILQTLRGAAPFDLVFMDPPYGCNLVPPVLEGLVQQKLLLPTALIVVETAPADILPDAVLHLTRLEQRRYGSTMIHLYAPAAEETEE